MHILTSWANQPCPSLTHLHNSSFSQMSSRWLECFFFLRGQYFGAHAVWCWAKKRLCIFFWCSTKMMQSRQAVIFIIIIITRNFFKCRMHLWNSFFNKVLFYRQLCIQFFFLQHLQLSVRTIAYNIAHFLLVLNCSHKIIFMKINLKEEVYFLKDFF